MAYVYKQVNTQPKIIQYKGKTIYMKTTGKEYTDGIIQVEGYFSGRHLETTAYQKGRPTAFY